MEKLVRITVLVLLSISCIYGQDEDILGLPVDYDIFGLDADPFYYKDVATPNEQISSNTVSEELLRKLCEEYDLQLDDQKLDCRNIRVVPKSLKIAEHSVQKRDVEDETPVEGSGEPDDIIPANDEPPHSADPETPQGEQNQENNGAETDPTQETANNEEASVQPVPYGEEKTDNDPESDTNEEAKAEGEETKTNDESPPSANVETSEKETNEESPSETKNVEENNMAQEVPETPTDEQANTELAVPYGEEQTNIDNKEAAANVGGTTVEPAVPYGENKEASEGSEGESATNEEANVQPAVVNEQDQTPSTTVAIKVEDNVNSENQASENGEGKPEEEAPAVETTAPEVAATENPIETEEAVTAVVKKGRILKPVETDKTESQDTENTKENEANKADGGNDSEKLHEHQSGNAVIDGPGSETLEGSEAVVRKMSAKENIKEPSNTDLPPSGQSTEETQQGRKDTKVLIILLVAVVVIGGAAFAYNFIKKRKQKKTEASRSENGSAAPQRTTPADKDAEQGTELKPLMRNADQKLVVEYKDEKQNSTTEVAN